MADDTIQLPPDSTGPFLDTESLTVGANTVHRERHQIAGDSATDIAPVTAADGLLVNLGANNDVSVAGSVAVTNAGLTALLGAIAGTEVQVDIVSGGGSGTQYTEDDAAPANPVGTALAMVRDDALSGQTTADGDIVAARSTDKGELYVKHVDAIPITDNSGSLTVDGTVAVSSVIPGTGATNLGKAIDSVAGATDTGVPALAVRSDIEGTLSEADGDYVPLRTDSLGALRVTFGGTNTTVNTELPAAAALADNTANPTVPAVGAFLMGFDGTNWDRLQTGAASGGALKVDGSAVTQPVSGTVAVTGVATAANQATEIASLAAIDADTSAIQTAVQLIDDTVQVLGTDVYTEATSKGITLGAVRRDADTTLVGTTNEFTPLQVDVNGRLKVEAFSGETLPVSGTITANPTGKVILSAGGSAASSGNNTLVAAGTNRLKVAAFSLTTTSTTAMTCIFQSGAGGTELWRVIIQAPTSVSAGANLATAIPGWLFATASATLLNLNLSSANAVHWSVSYYDEA